MDAVLTAAPFFLRRFNSLYYGGVYYMQKENIGDFEYLIKKCAVRHCLKNIYRLAKVELRNKEIEPHRKESCEKMIVMYETWTGEILKAEKALMGVSYKELYVFNEDVLRRIKEQKQNQKDILLARVYDKLSQDD